MGFFGGVCAHFVVATNKVKHSNSLNAQTPWNNLARGLKTLIPSIKLATEHKQIFAYSEGILVVSYLFFPGIKQYIFINHIIMILF